MKSILSVDVFVIWLTVISIPPSLPYPTPLATESISVTGARLHPLPGKGSWLGCQDLLYVGAFSIWELAAINSGSFLNVLRDPACTLQPRCSWGVKVKVTMAIIITICHSNHY